MGLLRLFFQDPFVFFALAVPLLYSVIAHEVAHGWVAFLFGDNTARWSGRLSLNPRKHLDLMGTLALFLVGFGWAKPVPVNYANLRHSKLGVICVALAGCGANIILATIALGILQVPAIHAYPLIVGILAILAKINIILGAFNLIPIPPLDGSKVLMELLPYNARREFIRIEPYGFFVLIFLIMTGMLNPVIDIAQRIIVSIIDFII